MKIRDRRLRTRLYRFRGSQFRCLRFGATVEPIFVLCGRPSVRLWKGLAIHRIQACGRDSVHAQAPQTAVRTRSPPERVERMNRRSSAANRFGKRAPRCEIWEEDLQEPSRTDRIRLLIMIHLRPGSPSLRLCSTLERYEAIDCPNTFRWIKLDNRIIGP